MQHLRRILALAALAAPLLAAPAAADPRPLTEPEVRAFVAEVESAAAARDVERIGATMAADCRIEIRTHFEGREHVVTMSKDEYLGMLDKGFSGFRDLQSYAYDIEPTAIRIEGAHAATVVGRVREDLVIRGVESATLSDETWRVERRDGRLVLAEVVATTRGAGP